MGDVTHILETIESRDPRAADELLPAVYDDLRRLASHKLAREKPGHTLQATALVHEAFLRLVDVEKAHRWNGRGHFFAAAAEAMRRILIENARRKGRLKRGGRCRRLNIDSVDLVAQIQADELLQLDDAISRLAERDPAAAHLVMLRYFAGLTIDHAAAAMGIAVSTAYRHWAYARAWLHSELLEGGD